MRLGAPSLADVWQFAGSTSTFFLKQLMVEKNKQTNQQQKQKHKRGPWF